MTVKKVAEEMRRIAVAVGLIVALYGAAHAGGVDSCDSNGTVLAAGATTPECRITLPNRTAQALACMTIAKANVIAAQSTRARLVLGGSNPEPGANPMKPYTGLAHVGSIPPQEVV